MSDFNDDLVCEVLQKIRNSAPTACELDDCHHLQTAVDRLIEYAWIAVNRPSDKDETESDQ